MAPTIKISPADTEQQPFLKYTDDDSSPPILHDVSSAESQEQVRLAFEQGDVVDREFKGVRTDLSRSFGMASDETINSIGFKVEITTRASAFCRSIACKVLKNEKMAKGELRLGLLTVFQGDHISWCYKHW